MFKKLLLLSLVLLFMSMAPLANAAPTATLSPQSQSSGVGESVNVQLLVSDVIDLYAWQFDISFDTSRLQWQGVAEGAWPMATGNSYFLEGAIDPADGVFRGTIGGLFGAGPGLDGSGSLALFEFLTTSSGDALLALENVVLLDSSLSDMPFDLVGATITVAGNTLPEPDALSLVVLGLGLTFAQARVRRSRPRL